MYTENSRAWVGTARAILEPHGIDLRAFSLSNFGDDLVFGDLKDYIHHLPTGPVVKEVQTEWRLTAPDQPFCQWAARKNRGE